MKRTLLLGIVLCLAVFQSQAQNVVGKGPMVKKTINMSDINAVGLGISATVYIQQGSSQSITIEAQQNIIDIIKQKPKGKSWNIEFTKKSVRNHKDITIYITMKDLKELSIGGSGSIIGKGKFSNLGNMELNIGGSGDIKLDADMKNVECSIGGSGKIVLDGSASGIEVSIGGSGDVLAFGLSTKSCEVSSAGSGDIEVSVSDNLEVSLVGSGDVRYRGNPKVSSTIMGSGDVKPE